MIKPKTIEISWEKHGKKLCMIPDCPNKTNHAMFCSIECVNKSEEHINWNGERKLKDGDNCEYCNSTNTEIQSDSNTGAYWIYLECNNCGHQEVFGGGWE